MCNLLSRSRLKKPAPLFAHELASYTQSGLTRILQLQFQVGDSGIIGLFTNVLEGVFSEVRMAPVLWRAVFLCTSRGFVEWRT